MESSARERFEHVQKFPLSILMPATTMIIFDAVSNNVIYVKRE